MMEKRNPGALAGTHGADRYSGREQPVSTISWALGQAYGAKALDAECHAITSAPAGYQERTLGHAALKLGGLVAGGYLDPTETKARLMAAGRAMRSYDPSRPWRDADILLIVERALAKGATTPRGPSGERKSRIHAKADFKPVERIYENPTRDNGPIVARIWSGCIESADTVAAVYLRHRGLTIDPGPDIRFAPRLRHNSGSDWPAMVAAVRNVAGDIVAIHRTFLAIDGKGKAPVTPSKMMLGPVGGGAVRLATAGPALLVGEGIESTLAAMMLSGLPGWAALSAGGIKELVLPPLPIAAKVTIAADNDPVGLEAAYAAADRWAGEGRAVRIAKPPAGQDFNDMLMEGARNAA